MNKRVLIWSGGYDSTYVLIKEVLRGNKIECWSFNVDRIGEVKNEIEHERRKKILDWLENKGYKVPYQEFSFNFNDAPISSRYPQQHLWTVITHLMADIDTTFLFGFHEKDYFWKILTDLDYVRRYLNTSQVKDVKWEFPIEHTSKYEIVMDILATPELCDLVWTCENPIKKDEVITECEKCKPCIALKTAIYEANLVNYKGFSLLTKDICEKKVLEELEVTEKDEKSYKRRRITMLIKIKKWLSRKKRKENIINKIIKRAEKVNNPIKLYDENTGKKRYLSLYIKRVCKFDEYDGKLLHKFYLYSLCVTNMYYEDWESIGFAIEIRDKEGNKVHRTGRM